MSLRCSTALAVMLPALAACSMMVSCKGTPDGVLDKEDMASLIADIHKGEAAIDLSQGRLMTDSMRHVVRESVYAAHGVTAAEVDSSLSYYGHHIEDYLDVYDMAIAQLQEQFDNATAVTTFTAQSAVVGDSVDLWPYARRMVIGPDSPSRLLTWELNRDESWEAGDTYNWGFKIVNSATPVRMRMLADYDNGVVEWLDATSQAEGRWLTTSFTLDTLARPLRVYGIAEFDGARSEYVYIDSIMLTRQHADPEAPRIIRYRYKRFKP